MSSEHTEYVGKAWPVFWAENCYMAVDSLGICKYHTAFLGLTLPNFEDWVKVLYYNTGLEMTPKDIWECAERANMMERLFNLREGLKRDDLKRGDMLNHRYFVPASTILPVGELNGGESMFRRPSIPWTVAAIVLTAAASAPAADKAPAPSSPVVTPAWLAEHLDAPDIVLVDTRVPLREYLAGHIPGAQPLSVENLRSVSRGVPGTLYSWDTLRLVVQRLGIRKETHVVVYGAENDTDQTYVASVLAAAGVGRVSVLDGGMKAWTAAQRPVCLKPDSATLPVKANL